MHAHTIMHTICGLNLSVSGEGAAILFTVNESNANQTAHATTVTDETPHTSHDTRRGLVLVHLYVADRPPRVTHTLPAALASGGVAARRRESRHERGRERMRATSGRDRQIEPLRLERCRRGIESVDV